jgi:hypothetical protein
VHYILIVTMMYNFYLISWKYGQLISFWFFKISILYIPCMITLVDSFVYSKIYYFIRFYFKLGDTDPFVFSSTIVTFWSIDYKRTFMSNRGGFVFKQHLCLDFQIVHICWNECALRFVDHSPYFPYLYATHYIL